LQILDVEPETSKGRHNFLKWEKIQSRLIRLQIGILINRFTVTRV
jgi:hypothetical protein